MEEPVTLGELLVEVWRQALVEGQREVKVGDRGFAVGRTKNQGLKVVSFSFREHALEGIEQNPRTRSRWALLAQEGKRVMQFSSRGRYVGNVCEGRLTRYAAWTALSLPE